MSRVALSGNALGTGTFTIASPNSNTDRTLNLPDQTGTLLTGSGAIGVNASAPTNSLAVAASGNVGIGTSSPSDRLTVNDGNIRMNGNTATTFTGFINQNTGASSSAYRGLFYDAHNENGIAVANMLCNLNTDGSSSWEWSTTPSGARTSDRREARVLIDGAGNLRVPGIFNLTTGAGANVHVSSDGTLYRSTSSLKYKTDVQDTTHGLAQVMQLRPVTYKGKNDGDVVFGGLIAEEVHEAGLTEFVQYAEDGTPDALAYANMVSLAFKAIQEQQAIITAQAAALESLTARITALEQLA